MKDQDTEKTTILKWKTCLRLGITALAVYLCVRYWDSLEGFIGLLLGGITAIIVGLVLAYIANIPLRFFERKLPGERGDGTLNRTISLILAILCIIAVVAFVGILVVPQLVNAVIVLAQDAPAIIDGIASNEFIRSFIPASILAQLTSIQWSDVVNDAASWLQSGLVSSLPQITSLIGQIGAWFMGIALAFWFLAEKDRLASQFHRLVSTYMGKEYDERGRRSLALIDDCFHGYIVGQSLEALIFGVLISLASVIIGLPYGVMLGALVGAMSLIPMIGAPIGAALGALIVAATSWQQALIFLIVFFVVQQIEANFVYPRVVGKHVGLKGMWPLIGITLGVALFGIVGAFVGVPITSAIFRIVSNDLAYREELPEDTPSPLTQFQKRISD